MSLAEIESLFRNALAVFPDLTHSSRETRFKAIGRTAARRSVPIVFTLRAGTAGPLIRPIGARYMHAKEILYYEEEAAKAEKR